MWIVTVYDPNTRTVQAYTEPCDEIVSEMEDQAQMEGKVVFVNLLEDGIKEMNNARVFTPK